MKSHLKSKHDVNIDDIEISVENEIQKSDSGASSSFKTNTLDKFVVRESVDEKISREASQLNATFRYLSKSPLIKQGLSSLGFQDKVPKTHRSVARMVHKSAEKHREIVRIKLKRLKNNGQRFCLVTDEWTCGIKRRRYQNVTLHIKGNIFLDSND